MMDPNALEQAYQEYMQDLPRYAPDGIIDVDLSLLSEFGLLECEEEPEDDTSLSQSFYVIESPEKLTLFNQKYVVWIVPQVVEEAPTTYTLIALNEDEKTHLEMIFATSGVYNHSSLVLRILEKFLEQIEENEKEIIKIKDEEKENG